MNLTREYLLSAYPDTSEVFDNAVERTLNRIRFEAALESRRAGHIQIKRILGWGLALLLLLAGVLGIAEGVRRGVFDFLLGREGVLPEAADLALNDTATMQVGDTEIRITESVFDGATLRFVMSIVCKDMDRPVEEEELWDMESEFGQYLQKDGVIALGSFDWFTVDGVEYSMTSGSGGENVAGSGNGEALIYFELKLTSTEGIEVPEGDFTVGLPVLSYAIKNLRDGVSREEAQMLLPVKRLPMESIRDIAPKEPQPMGSGTVTVLEARLSPIKVYITLRVDFPEDTDLAESIPAITQWGEFTLVDAQGQEICPPGGYVWGWGVPADETDEQRHLWMQGEFYPAESYPDEIYLAPIGPYGEDGAWSGDMNLAVRLAP